MNIKKLKEAINAGYDDKLTRHLIINILSEDEEVVPTIMEILAAERKRKKKLLDTMNLELSRAHITIENPAINEGNFVVDEITKFYLKNKEQVGHCFKDLRNVELPPEDEDKISYT